MNVLMLVMCEIVCKNSSKSSALMNADLNLVRGVFDLIPLRAMCMPFGTQNVISSASF